MNSIKQIKQEVGQRLPRLFKERQREHITFHTIERALDLAAMAEKIAEKADLPEEQICEVVTAAAFLYTGHWQTSQDALFTSAENAKDFAETYEVVNAKEVVQLIHSVSSASEDKSPQEQVLYDTYYAYYGQKKFIRSLKLKSLEAGKEQSLTNTYRQAQDSLNNHKYRTPYAIKAFGERKAINSQKLQAALQKKVAKTKKRKRKSQKLGRGIETMYRSIYRTHINLSSIADQKANLIIRVNTIILSIIITLGGTGYTFFETGFFKYTRFTIPVMLFVLGSLLAVIFAVLSARPKVTNKEVDKQRLLGNESSILFFGNFISLDKKDFLREMSLFRANNERVYDSMSVDLYYLGKVLDKKYQLVKIAYNVFMLGLALSVVSFMGIFMYSQLTQ